MIRTRFAPSPTGYLHVGGLRTALYAYLLAKKSGGSFILRIEDTDQNRNIEGATEHLIEILHHVGLDYDEGPAYHEKPAKGGYGPYIQSQRTDIYRKYADELIEKGAAYHCFCTPERLTEMRERQIALKQAPMYDRRCLKLSPEEIAAKKEAGEPCVIRQKIPSGQKFRFKDLVRGTVAFNTDNIDDQVLMKSDNFPTYHLANVVDDHLMEVSHVIRGEEWLPSTPKHILLYQAFGWEPPEFAHLSLLLNKDKSKLSKRQGDVSVESYLEKGYCIPALINFIAMLGWHPGKGTEQEIFSMEDLIQSFDLEQVHKSGAIFDLEKLDWYNYKWLKALHHQELEKVAREIDPKAEIGLNNRKEPTYSFSSPDLDAAFQQKRGDILLKKFESQLKEDSHTKERMQYHHGLFLRALVTIEDKLLKDPRAALAELECFFEYQAPAQDLILNEKMKVDATVAKQGLQACHESLSELDETIFQTITQLQEHLIALIQELGLKNGQVLWPLRAALSGKQYSPGAFEMLWALGKDEALKRLEESLKGL